MAQLRVFFHTLPACPAVLREKRLKQISVGNQGQNAFVGALSISAINGEARAAQSGHKQLDCSADHRISVHGTILIRSGVYIAGNCMA